MAKMGTEKWKGIIQQIENNEILELNLGCQKITETDAEALAEALKKNTSLKKLILYMNEIGLKGGIAIGKALKVNKSLQELNLGKNNIGLAGIKTIAEALQVNTSLQQLDLQCNNIGPEGAKFITEALKVNKSLKKLYLYGTNIGPEGAKFVAEALKVNRNLLELNLQSNQIGPEGILAIVEALEINFSLQKVMVVRALFKEEDARISALNERNQKLAQKWLENRSELNNQGKAFLSLDTKSIPSILLQLPNEIIFYILSFVAGSDIECFKTYGKTPVQVINRMGFLITSREEIVRPIVEQRVVSDFQELPFFEGDSEENSQGTVFQP